MSRAPALCLVLAALLLLALAAPVVAATSSSSVASHSLFDPLWQWLQRLGAADGGYVDPLGFKLLARAPRVDAPHTSSGGVPHRWDSEISGFSTDAPGRQSVSPGRVHGSVDRRRAAQPRAQR
jgi:hypothetical protein